MDSESVSAGLAIGLAWMTLVCCKDLNEACIMVTVKLKSPGPALGGP